MKDKKRRKKKYKLENVWGLKQRGLVERYDKEDDDDRGIGS